MRRITLTFAALAATTLIAGCNAETAGQTARTFTDAKAGNRTASASGMVGSAVAAQAALYHITSALSAQVSKDLDKPKAFRMAQAAADQPAYSIDLAAGTGTVQLVRAGKKAIDLSFRFTQEARDGGMLYNVSSLRGTTEGFQVLLPSLSLVYTAALDDQGNTLKSASGETVFQVSAKAHGFLGVDNRPAFQIADMAFNVRYPFPTTETRIGSVKLFSPDGLVFDGEAYLTGPTLTAKGHVSDTAGTKLYDLSVGADGKATMIPVAATTAPAATSEP